MSYDIVKDVEKFLHSPDVKDFIVKIKRSPYQTNPYRTGKQATTIGVQYLYKFTNGYGASVIINPYSYGWDEGLWELAVIKWQGKDFHLCYDTPITDDVERYLTPEEVLELLDEIKELSMK